MVAGYESLYDDVLAEPGIFSSREREEL